MIFAGHKRGLDILGADLGTGSDSFLVDDETQPTGLPPEAVARMQEEAGDFAAAERTRRTARVARGDSFLDDGDEAQLKSQLPGVPDQNWTQFVRCLIVAEVTAVSDGNQLGMFALSPRRLRDLGYVTEPVRSTNKGKTIWVCRFVPETPDEDPSRTAEKFLRSRKKQYGAFSRSMQDYTDKMKSGEIDRGEESLSGALTVLHRAGPRGLETWRKGERFEGTVRLYSRTAGLF